MNTACPVEEIIFNSASDLVDYLRLSNRHWGGGHASTWVFRGQSDASWLLIPSAWREPGKSLLEPLIRNFYEYVENRTKSFARLLFGVYDFDRPAGYQRVFEELASTSSILNVNQVNALAQTAAEVQAVHDFLELADNVGLHIPSGRPYSANVFFSDLGLVEKEIFGGPLLDSSLLSPTPHDTFGLAQHHGIPTRLLDWTRNPLIAAFFAAQNASPDCKIAIWAVNTKVLSQKSRVRILTCRRYENSFLHAQDGLFLWDQRATLEFAKHGRWPTLDEAFAYDLANPNIISEPSLRKLILPTDELKALFLLLWRERVSLAHIMPTYDHIARSLYNLWQLQTRVD